MAAGFAPGRWRPLRFFRAVAFQQRVVQGGAVFDLVRTVGIRRRQDLAIQVAGDFRLALIKEGRGDPTHGVGWNGHALGHQLVILADHFVGARAIPQRAQAIDAPASHVFLGLRVRSPGAEQLVVIGQGTVGDDEAFFFTAGGKLGQAHALGRHVAFQAALGHRIEQPGALASQAQGRLRQACPLQGDNVFTGDFRLVAGADKRLVVFEQSIIGRARTGQRVTQCQTARRVIGLGRHQGSGPGNRLGGLAGIGLGHGQAQLQVGVLRVALQGLTVDLGRRIPAFEVAIGASRGGQRLHRQYPVARLMLIDVHHL